MLQLYEKEIKKVQMFCTYECSFVVTLVIHSKPFQAARGDILFRQGDVCKEIVFIPTGMVRLSVESGNGKDTLAGFATEGTYFGDMEFLKNSVITLAQYSAMNNCEFLSVSYLIMSQAIAENLESGTSFRNEAEKRLTAFKTVTKSQVNGERNSRSTLRRRSTKPGMSAPVVSPMSYFNFSGVKSSPRVPPSRGARAPPPARIRLFGSMEMCAITPRVRITFVWPCATALK